MRNTVMINARNDYEKGLVKGIELFEDAVEEFILLVSVGEMPSELHACDFFAEKLHELTATLNWRL